MTPGPNVNKKLLLACPSYGPVDPVLQKSLRVAIMVAAQHGVHWQGDASPDRMGFSAARNAVAQACLDTPDSDGVLWVDSDMLIPNAAIWKLMLDVEAHDAEFVTGIYYQRREPHMPLIYKWREDIQKFSSYVEWDENVMAEIHGCGFGFCYTSRKLLAAIAALPSFDKRAGWFPDTRDNADGFGEDFNFALKAMQTGYKMFVSTGIELGHAAEASVITKDTFLKHRTKKAQETTKEDIVRNIAEQRAAEPSNSTAEYDFYRCGSCRSLFTAPQEKAARDRRILSICGCGSSRYSPSFPVGLEWIKPSVIRFSIQRALGGA